MRTGWQRTGLTLSDVDATLDDARVPLHDVVRGNVTTVPVGRLTVSGLVPYAELEQLATRDLVLGPGPAGGLTVSGRVRVLGVEVDAAADAGVRVQAGHLVVTATVLRVAGAAATAAQARALARTFDLDLALPDLPCGLQLSSVRAEAAGVRLSGTRTDAVLVR